MKIKQIENKHNNWKMKQNNRKSKKKLNKKKEKLEFCAKIKVWFQSHDHS